MLALMKAGGTSTEALVGFIGFVVIAGGIAIALLVGIVRSARAESREREAGIQE